MNRPPSRRKKATATASSDNTPAKDKSDPSPNLNPRNSKKCG
ncbi:hypothetical protein [Nostoc sp.]